MSNPSSLIASVTNGVLSVLLAPTCAACNAILETPLDGCVCRNCWEAIPPVADAALAEDSPLSGLIAVGSYDGTLRDIIHALKYQARRSIAGRLAILMRMRASHVLPDADCVVPVPLHWRRAYSRGFNQALEIGRELGPPVLDALVRIRSTAPQVELSAEERQTNVKGAFAVRRASPLRAAPPLQGRRIVLIDDVATTGATLEACARVLKAAGAPVVWGLTAARTL